MEDDKKSFSYTYSAKQNQEIEEIRKKYIPKEENKMDQLRKLDKSAQQKGTMVSIGIGVVSSLVLGLGMSCTLVWKNTMFVPGIIIGIIGIGGMALAYPTYNYVSKKQREKIAPQILKLTEELSK